MQRASGTSNKASAATFRTLKSIPCREGYHIVWSYTGQGPLSEVLLHIMNNRIHSQSNRFNELSRSVHVANKETTSSVSEELIGHDS